MWSPISTSNKNTTDYLLQTDQVCFCHYLKHCQTPYLISSMQIPTKSILRIKYFFRWQWIWIEFEKLFSIMLHRQKASMWVVRNSVIFACLATFGLVSKALTSCPKKKKKIQRKNNFATYYLIVQSLKLNLFWVATKLIPLIDTQFLAKFSPSSNWDENC